MSAPAYYAGDRAPIAIAFVLGTGTVAASAVDVVRVIVRMPDGTERDWQLSPIVETSSRVRVERLLASDGSDAPREGVCHWEAYLYGPGGGEALAKTRENTFTIGPSRIAWPAPLPTP